MRFQREVKWYPPQDPTSPTFHTCTLQWLWRWSFSLTPSRVTLRPEVGTKYYPVFFFFFIVFEIQDECWVAWLGIVSVWFYVQKRNKTHNAFLIEQTLVLLLLLLLLSLQSSYVEPEGSSKSHRQRVGKHFVHPQHVQYRGESIRKQRKKCSGRFKVVSQVLTLLHKVRRKVNW